MADDYSMMDDFLGEETKPRGRGWHGDSVGHARAGRKGGKAKRKNRGQTTTRSRS